MCPTPRARPGARRGATVLAGGAKDDGPWFFYRPTVVAGVEQGDEVVQKEAFGDLITVQRFGTDGEALCLANGLTDSEWSENVGRALGGSRKLRVGTVRINEHTNLTSEMSHGGFKQFGYGKDMSVYAVEDYTVVKHVMARLA